MATRFYYSCQYPPDLNFTGPAPISSEWMIYDEGYGPGTDSWYIPYGRITPVKIPFGPDPFPEVESQVQYVSGNIGPNTAPSWWPPGEEVPPFKRFCGQFYSAPLAAQTISGSVKGQALCQEILENREGWWNFDGALADISRAIVIRVFSGDFSVERGVLLAHFPESLVSEFPEAEWDEVAGKYLPLTNRSFPPSSALNEVVCEDGDIMVVEVGFICFGDVYTETWGNYQAQILLYCNTPTDLPEDEASTDEVDAWLEFDTDLLFQSPARAFSIDVNLSTEGEGFCKYREYTGLCETALQAPGYYGMPIPGVDEKSGYGIVDLSFLDGDAPLYMIPIFPLNINPAAVSIEPYAPAVSDAYAANGCFQITGAGVLGETVPPISEYASSGAFILVGSGVLGAPPRTDFRAAGQFELSGTCRMTSTSSYPLVTQYEAGGSLALFGPCSLESVLAQVDAFMAAGCYSLSGRSALGVIMPSLRVDEYVAAGCYELHGPCSTVRGPVYAYAADTTGPCLEITSRARVGFIFPQKTAMAAQGGYVLESPGVPDEGVFETLVLTGARSEVSVYSNFKFNSYAKYGGKYYGATQDGIFLLEGDDDAGIQIHTGAKIGPTNFGTDREKRLRLIRCGGDCDLAQVRVSDGNGKSGQFPVRAGRADISRAVQGRELTVEIVDFKSLNHLEIIPLVLAKR